MECENVFIAARVGDLNELKNVLNNKSKDEVIALVSALTNGATPLAIASRNGHLDVVTYLLKECHADVDQECELEFDAYGTPLFWAAAYGHLNTVKALIKYKASVNSIVKLDHPLGIACSNGKFEVAEYLIEQGANIELPDSDDTCLRITCLKGYYYFSKYLVEHGADVNRIFEDGGTPLHASVSSGKLGIIKLLLQHGAVMNTDGDGFTPLLYAALRSYIAIVQYFLVEYDCTTQEVVDALELLGATFVDEKQDMIAARNCWKIAMQLRYEGIDIPLAKPTDKSPMTSYIHETEVRTLDQLDALTVDEMEIQSLLFRERILGPGNSISLYFIRHRAGIYADNVNLTRCIRLWMYIFDTESDQVRMLNYSTLLTFTVLFHKIITETLDSESIIPGVSFYDLLLVFKSVLSRIEITMDMTQAQENENIGILNNDILIVVLYLVGLMCKLQPHLNVNEEKSLKTTVYKFVHLNPKGNNNFTLLHIASRCDSLLEFNDDFPYLPFFLPEFALPSSKVVDLLLDVGACPNALDSSKNSPLHVAAMNRPFDEKVFRSLLNHMAHLDFCNNENETPLQLVPVAYLLNIYPLRHLNLQCLCAQAINKHKIAYKDLLQNNLYEFVASHDSH